MDATAEDLPFADSCFDAAMTTFSVHQWSDLRAGRRSCSAWSFVTAAVHDRFARDLSRDLSDGTWDDRYGYLRARPSFEGFLILAVSRRPG